LLNIICNVVTLIFTDGSKDPKTGHAGSVYIPKSGVICWEIMTSHLSVYTTELGAILLALKWVEGNDLNHSVIISESY